MKDPRISRLAETLVRYSLGIKRGEILRINAMPEAAPLIQEVYAEAIGAGAHPFLRLGLPGISEIFYQNASDEQLEFVSDITLFEAGHIDTSLSILSSNNTRSLTGVPPGKITKHHRAQAPLMKILFDREAEGSFRWCGTAFPTPAGAQDADMGTLEFEDFVLSACFADRDDPVAAWQEVHEKQEGLKKALDRVREMRIEAPGTDLRIRTEARTWENCSGKKNMPDGEIFTSPVEDSAEGVVFYPFPTVYSGRPVKGVRLEFKEGRVVSASAELGEDYLKKALELDEGASRLGELAFGTNPNIKRITKNMLFDEKIAGTMHMALGRGFPKLGGKNNSVLHWDLLVDMHAGRVSADGAVIYENGEFLI